LRTAFLSGSAQVTPSLLGKIEVVHVVAPTVTVTGTERNPRGGNGSAAISSPTSAGTVAKNQSSARDSQRQTSDSKRYVTGRWYDWSMAEHSAGILLHRRGEVLAGHMGGPFWARKQAGAWSIPKGLIGPGESAHVAALREFEEELGIPAPAADYRHLGDFRYSSGKLLTVYTAEADLDLSGFQPGTFEVELRGRPVTFPELDEVRWLSGDEARELLVKGQRPALDALSTRP
jgi:predicted NUDIX family NTP pyrophosphohydrolase